MSGLLTSNIEPKFSDEVIDYLVPWTADLGEGESLTGPITVKTTNGLEADVMTTTDNVTRLRVSDGNAGSCLIDLTSSTTSGQVLGIRLKITITARS
ncbi:hypothetical protein [Brevundimonas vesicularis]|uniref:phage fiber-tail adaptor protein n=1 Tax=Brevundimonas vesicularis TaxID=41276 RepID=UPI0028B01D36|nr:hypothetical protein [Brevundimonas vesicularis]